MSQEFYDAFISYGRVDSKAFAIQLCQDLEQHGLKVWLDYHDIPLAVDFQNEIDNGIGKSHNFLFIIAPHSVNSKYCHKEINLALQYNKRIIPLLHVEEINRDVWQQRFPEGTDQEWADAQVKGLTSSFLNMHPAIAKINWIYFRQDLDNYDTSLLGLIQTFKQHHYYVQQHTMLLAKALKWQHRQKQSRYLLIGEAREQAETWLKMHFQDCQPPCLPTDLHCEFITESKKNARNLMAQVFLAYAEENRDNAEQIRRFLRRQGFTVWISAADIPAGANFQTIIEEGIEEADNVVYLMSPAAIRSPFCQHEIEYALRLQKRVIPLLIEAIALELIPLSLRNLQHIDLTHQGLDIDNFDGLNPLIKILKQDEIYHEEHKILLTKALKWERQHQNPSILLRGYNLRHAEAWLKVANTRDQYQPTSLQETFIQESLRQPPLSSLDVFISYSRADSDFARTLNDALQLQGKTTWFDQESIATGTDFQQEINRGIACCDNFLFILSPRSLNSPYCRDEVAYAAQHHKRMIPVLAQPIQVADLPPEIATIQWIDFSQAEGDFYNSFTQLIRTLDTDRDHVHNHTKWSQRAIEWEHKNRSEDLLLRGTELAIANSWLRNAEESRKQPLLTSLQKDFICTSEAWQHQEIKNRQRRRLFITSSLTVGLFLTSTLAGLAWWQSQQSILSEIEATAKSSQLFFASDNTLDALILAMRAEHKLHRILNPDTTTQSEVKTAIWQAIYGLVEFNRLEGHKAWIWDIAFNSEGDLLATASSDKTIKLWKPDGSLVDTLRGHNAEVNSVAFSPDGQLIASAGNDGAVILWTPEGKLLKTLTTDSQFLFGVAFSPDSQTLVSVGSGKTVQVWRRDGSLLQTLQGHSTTIRSVAISMDGQTIASAGEDGILNLWAMDGTLRASIPAHTAEIFSVAFSPDGQTFATASGDKTVKLWSLDGTLLKTYTEHQARVFNVTFSADGNMIASVGRDRTIHVWRPDGFTLATFNGHEAEVWGVAFSPDSSFLATTSGDRTAKFWKLNSTLFLELKQHSDEVWGIAFSSDGETIASASRDRTVKLWSHDGIFLRDLGEVGATHAKDIRSVTFSPDNQRIATASWDKTVKLWTRDGQLISTLTHEDLVNGVAFSSDSQKLGTASSDGTVRIWSRDGQFLQLLEQQLQPMYSVAFSSDGQRIATASYDGLAKVWTSEGELISSLVGHEKTIGEIVFSPDGQRIATASWDETIRLWTRDGELIRSLEGHTDGISGVAFSPDGRFIASASWDKTLKLWDYQGNLLRTFTNHSDRVTSVAFNPTRPILASASADNSIILWNLEQMLQLNPLDYGCSWIRNYLHNNPNVSPSDKRICD